MEVAVDALEPSAEETIQLREVSVDRRCKLRAGHSHGVSPVGSDPTSSLCSYVGRITWPSAQSRGETPVKRSGHPPEIARFPDRVLARCEPPDQILPPDRSAVDELLDEGNSHAVAFDDARERRNMRESVKCREQLHLWMRPALRAAEELQDQAIVERYDRVGQVLGQEPRLAWSHVGSRSTRERCPEGIVTGAFTPLAKRQRVALSLAAFVLDVHERDRRSACTVRSEPTHDLEPGNSAALAREPARFGECRDVG